jgi:hypothetical protein
MSNARPCSLTIWKKHNESFWLLLCMCVGASVFICVHGGKLITGCDCIINLFNSQAVLVVLSGSCKRDERDAISAAPKSKKSDTNARVISEICNCTGVACMVIGSSD